MASTPTFDIPLLGFCASTSGMGKTTLLTRLIPQLTDRGLRVSIIKHAHHSFDVDHPGKDSYRLRAAGAVQTLLGSRRRWALMTELAPIAGEPDLATLAAKLDPGLADIVLVEGFKGATIPKIEIHRPALGAPLLAASDSGIIAVASNAPVATTLPLLDLDDPAAIADFVIHWRRAHPAVSGTL